ncbi:40S ribosomal protein SSA [Guillardia theta]|uniref:Small ribosomal subunit protein uS2 n=1 Tax=Guillardia theta TaxID=55529 RepID=Q9AW71_GUITH|nr:40S ribosomal protein SSA [Guillardia theta]CAC26999.1 40S ribosomal protein SSA [Guillardia theta]|mmetsp:Transcript_42032/g.132471  ORF Transcript_42032/g.132471 Transcript_42032/m.132471 type:complete len:200 (-) Transcript_42032:406-1005(-)
MIYNENDIKKLLICNVHIGLSACTQLMKVYVWKKRSDGIYIINILKTIQKIELAARAIISIEHPKHIIAVSSNNIHQTAIIKFSQFIQCNCIVDKWIPGKLTNKTSKLFEEPRLLIISDPLLDKQALLEASYVNIPVISVCNTDSFLSYIDIAIPGNNKDRYSFALIIWLLTKKILIFKGELTKNCEWNVSVESFIEKF